MDYQLGQIITVFWPLRLLQQMGIAEGLSQDDLYLLYVDKFVKVQV